jgi:hypothetical protein
VQLEHDPTVQRALLLDERIPYDLRRGGMMEYLSHTNLDTVDDEGGQQRNAWGAFVKGDGKTGFSKFAGMHMYHNGDFTPKPKKRRDGNWWERLHKNDEIEYSDTDRRAMKEAGDKAKKDAVFAAREEMSTPGLPPAEVSKKCEEIGLQAKEDAERAALDALKAESIAKAKSKARTMEDAAAGVYARDGDGGHTAAKVHTHAHNANQGGDHEWDAVQQGEREWE